MPDWNYANRLASDGTSLFATGPDVAYLGGRVFYTTPDSVRAFDIATQTSLEVAPLSHMVSWRAFDTLDEKVYWTASDGVHGANATTLAASTLAFSEGNLADVAVTAGHVCARLIVSAADHSIWCGSVAGSDVRA